MTSSFFFETLLCVACVVLLVSPLYIYRFRWVETTAVHLGVEVPVVAGLLVWSMFLILGTTVLLFGEAPAHVGAVAMLVSVLNILMNLVTVAVARRNRAVSR